jgi:hypothetical protein
VLKKEREKRVEKKSPEFFRGVGLFFVSGVCAPLAAGTHHKKREYSHEFM